MSSDNRRRIVSELWRRSKPYKNSLALVVLLSIVYTATDLMYPLVYRQVVNDVAGLFVKQVYDEAIEENTVLNDIIDELIGVEEVDSTEAPLESDSLAGESFTNAMPPAAAPAPAPPSVSLPQSPRDVARTDTSRSKRKRIEERKKQLRREHSSKRTSSGRTGTSPPPATTGPDSVHQSGNVKPAVTLVQAQPIEAHESGHIARRTPEQVVQTMVWAVVILFVLGMIGYALWLVGENTSERVASRIEQTFLLETFQHVLRLPFGFFRTRSSGVLTKQIDEADHISPIITTVSKQILPHAVKVVGTFAVMLALNSQLTLIVLITIPPYIWLARMSARRLEEGLGIYYELWERISARLQNAIYSIKTVKLAGAERREVEHLQELSDQAYAEYIQRNKVSTRFVFWDAFITHLGSAIVLVVGGYLALKRQLTPGDVVMFVVYVEELYSPIDALSGVWIDLQQNIASFMRTFLLLQSGEEEKSGNDLAECRGEVEFKNVSFSYVQSRRTLNNISLKATPGTITAIVGGSGAGKTTSMDLLLKLYDYDEGCISIDGHDIRDLDPSSIRSHIGLVAADGTVFKATLRENIAYSAPEADDATILAAVRDAGLSGMLERMPDGLDTEVGEAGIGLSVGERQRVQLARILAARPPILILDEATANLDFATEREIRETVQRFRSDRTVIIIAHRYSMVRDADVVYVFDEGSITESGTPAELLERGGWFARFAESTAH